MKQWLNELSKDQREFVNASKKVNSFAGIVKNAVDMYAEDDQFVFELLQNADDQGATEVTFELSSDKLEFLHNGRAFTKEDVYHITRIGNSSKGDEGNKIGKFGIGFKSVFSMTDRPQIVTTLDSQPFAFAIEDLVVPIEEEVTDLYALGYTCFSFPFKPKESEKLHNMIEKRLMGLQFQLLLFMNNIRTIH